MFTELIKIKEEHQNISEELKDLKRQIEFYILDNNLLRCKNCELNNEHNSLVLKIESEERMLQLHENEINKKREITILDILVIETPGKLKEEEAIMEFKKDVF